MLSFKMLPVVVCLFLGCAVLSSCGGGASNESANTSPSPTAAPPPDVGAMINRLITQDGCKDFSAEMRMASEEESGKREQIDFKVQRKYGPDKTSTFLSVLSPPEDSDKALLAVERKDQPTEAYSYLAGLKKLTKINSDRRLGFHGAKVTVQDMLAMELGQYDHGAGQRVTVDGEPMIKVDFKEKPYRNLAYPRLVGYFREKDQTPAKFEMYDYRDELQKRATMDEVKAVQNRLTVTRMSVDDLQQKLKVKVETRKVEYDRGLPDSLFTEARLKGFINSAVHRLDQQ